MATTLERQDELYNSASDEDFNPDAAPPDADAASSSDEEQGTNTRGKKRKEIAEDLGFDNSGDEATIVKSRRKGKKRKTDEPDDVGGDGGLIKTRAQRKAEVHERKSVTSRGEASVDVDLLWAQMLQKRPQGDTTQAVHTTETADVHVPSQAQDRTMDTTTSTNTDRASSEEMITIKRTYDFAGQTQTEERLVPASSAEARLYLQQQAESAAAATKPSRPHIPGLRRPLKRVSMFDTPASLAEKEEKAKKLNTLQKSKLDWAQHVDQEGISAELEEAKKAKGGYLGKLDFLGRMDAKRQDEGKL